MSAPSIVSGTTPDYAFSTAEGQGLDAELYVCMVQTAIGSPKVSFYLTGQDAALFNINNYGVLKSNVVFDYENPIGVNTDNTYELTITAINLDGSDEQNLTITVTDAAEITLSFVVVVEGEVYTPDPDPVLENPTETYGVIDIDSGEIIVAAGEAYTDAGTLWTYGISGEYDGVVMRYYVKVIINDVTYYLPRTTAYVKSACLVVGRYTTSHQIEQQYGVENVHKWLAIDDRDEAVDYALRYYEFIRDAEDEIDDALRDGGADIPYASTDIPSLIKRLAACLAGVRAYEARGVTDMTQDGQPTHRLMYQARWAYEQLRRIRGGFLRLSPDDAIRYPEVVIEDVIVDDDSETTYS